MATLGSLADALGYDSEELRSMVGLPNIPLDEELSPIDVGFITHHYDKEKE